MKNNSAFERQAMELHGRAFRKINGYPDKQDTMYLLKRCGQVVMRHTHYPFLVAERNRLCNLYPEIYNKQQFTITDK